jgi:hypothetical protein
MTITLNLEPEQEARLLLQARATGTTPEDYVRRLVERNLSGEAIDSAPSEGTGMTEEDGLLIYGAGTVLPAGFIDEALGRSRDERAQHLLGLLD